jgi:hypothetical protein
LFKERVLIILFCSGPKTGSRECEHERNTGHIIKGETLITDAIGALRQLVEGLENGSLSLEDFQYSNGHPYSQITLIAKEIKVKEASV